MTKTYIQTDLGAACEHINWLINQETPYADGDRQAAHYALLVRLSNRYFMQTLIRDRHQPGDTVQ